MSENNSSYLATLQRMVEQYFSLEDVRTLCLMLGVDYDSVPGDGKTARVRELILGLARQGRLPALLAMVENERSHVNWPSIPDDFELPSSGPWSGTPQPSQQTIVHGNLVEGDSYSVGDMNNVKGVAFGRGAQAIVNEGDTYSGDFRGAILNIKSTLSNVQQTIGGMSNANEADKQELQSLVQQLEDTLSTVPESHDEEAEAVSQTTEALVELAAAETPNKTMLQISGEGLKQAAKNLAAITPDVLKIATGIVLTVGKIAGLG